MRKSIYLFILATLNFSCSDSEKGSSVANNSDSLVADTGTYEVHMPPHVDPKEFKAVITLDPQKQIHQLKLPGGGTETDVLIYDSTYLKTIQENTIPKVEALVEGGFFLGDDVILDITSLPRGQYYVHYLSCNTGGIFPLEIK